MQKDRPYHFVISGGGTGGHIFPAIAIADELKRRFPSCEILFVGARDRMEMEKVPAAGYPIEGLWISGLQRSLSIKNLSFPFKLLSSLWKSRRILKKYKPQVVIGTGGYASAAILRSSFSRRIPSLIQEQNNYAGLTNKWLSKKVSKICVAYEGMEKFFPAEKLVVTGNPVRKQILDTNFKTRSNELYEKFGLDPNKKTILVVGGSLGARAINIAIEKDHHYFHSQNVQVLWQTGKLFVKESEKLRSEWIHPTEFIHNMNEAYQVADLIISRAGAIALSELAIVGKPVVLVPLSTAAEDHQTKNALGLVDRASAEMVSDKEAEDRLVPLALEVLGSDYLCNRMSTNIKQFAKPEAVQRIVDEIEKLMK